MQEAIEIKTEIVRDPAITAAIREIKSRIKELAASQKTGKKAFREAQNQWTKDSQKYNHAVPVWNDQSMTATALFVIYGKLRQTKRPHFPTQEAYSHYYDAEGVAWHRRQILVNELQALANAHPKAYASIQEIS